MSVILLNQPNQQQLRDIESKVDAYGAFLDALYHLKTPNYLGLEHELAAPGFTFSIGSCTTDLDGALRFIAKWHSCTENFGREHTTTELAYSTDGSRVVCLDRLTITLTSPVILPSGNRLEPGPTGRKTLRPRIAHFLRLAHYDGVHKIAEWKISARSSDFYKLLG